MNKRLYTLCNLLVTLSLVCAFMVPADPAWAAEPQAQILAQGTRASSDRSGFPALLLRAAPVRAASSRFWADVNGDQRVDALDLRAIAEVWNCRSDQPCYNAEYDRNGNGVIDVFDLAAVGNEYDVEPPQIVITTPAERAVVGGTSLQVSGTVSDVHAVTLVTINGVAAVVNNGTFEATVPIAAGNQVLTVSAVDEVGLSSAVTRLIFADQEGPFITIHIPRHRQSVYTLRPAIELTYSDFYAAVNPSTLQAVLSDDNGLVVDVTGSLTIGADGASGVVGFDLSEDTVYTLTATLQDSLGNPGSVHASFYVPLDAASITPPDEPENAGWVSGIVYDSSTCDVHLIACQGMAGARVTLERLDEEALQAARLARADERRMTNDEGESLVVGRWSFVVDGVVVTGPDGFFAFPVDATARYALRVEKEGYTYGQRVADIVLGHSTPVNEIYVTPLDAAVTPCDENGCEHESSDGRIQLSIPPGAVAAGDVVPVQATEFDRVVFLPSGELPPGTAETYAFNLSGDSGYVFEAPFTVRIRNSRGFAPGTEIPVGYWNDELLQWEHETVAVVDASGEWVEASLTHFSNWDINQPSPLANMETDDDDETGHDGDGCGRDPCASEVLLRSGNLRQELVLPGVEVLGMNVAPAFNYDSSRAAPSELIELSLGHRVQPGVEVGDFIQVELYIEGQKTANFTFAAGELAVEGRFGHFRYLWDGRNAQGQRLPPGVYPYAVRIRVPYRAEYFAPVGNIFGNPPDLTRPLGVFTNVTSDRWVVGAVLLAGDPDNDFGAGWALAGQQRLYEDEAGRIIVDDGYHNLANFYFPAKNLLPPPTLAAAADSDLASLFRVGEPASGELASGEFASEEWVSEELASGAEAEEQGSRGAEEQLTSDNSQFTIDNSLLTDVGGSITTDTTWTLAESPFVMTSNVIVEPGVTLTIEPGVVVQGNAASRRLVIHGHLAAIGTPTQPITFTSVSDSAPGQWGGLAFDGGTGHLDHTTIRFAGASSSLSGFIYAASILARNVAAGAVRLENSQVLNGRQGGGVDQGLLVIDSQVVVNNSFFAGNGDTLSDRVISASGAGTVITLTNNIFQDNPAVAARIPAESLHLVTNNSFSGNGRNRIELLGGTIANDLVMAVQPGLEAYEIVDNITVSPGATVTVAPAVTVMAAINSGFIVNGRLEAIGTAEQPILFTRSGTSGHWRGIAFDGGGGHLAHVTVSFGGGLFNLPGFLVCSCGLVARNVSGGPLIIENSQLLNNFNVNGTDQALRVIDSQVVVNNTLFANNGNALSDHVVLASGANTLLTLTNNVFQNNPATAVRLPAETLHLVSGNSFSGNGRNRIQIQEGGAVVDGLVLALEEGQEAYELMGALTVPAGATMTVAPGAIILAASLTHILVSGHLEAVGRAEQPILFTRNTVNWRGLAFHGGTGRLEHTTVSFSGNAYTLLGIVCACGILARNVGEGQLIIENSRLLNNSNVNGADQALRIMDSQVVVRNTLFANNGNNVQDTTILVTGGGAFNFSDNILQNNSGGPLRLPAALLPGMGPNLFLNPPSSRIIADDNWTLAADLSLPLQSGMDGYQFQGNVTVAAGAALRLPPGANLYWASNRGVTVNGLLEAVGTEAQPILFISAAAIGNPGQWNGITVNGGQATLEHTTVRYATTGLRVDNGRADLLVAKVMDNQTNGVLLTGTSVIFSAVVSEFSGNGSFGLRNDTGLLVDARFNWWGDPTGPFHPNLNPGGLSNQVSNNVLFIPWLDQPVSHAGIHNLTPSDHTILTFNESDQTYSRHYPDGTIVHFDAHGRHDFTLSPTGLKLAYSYDANGRTTSMSITPPGEMEPRWTWSFDYQDFGFAISDFGLQESSIQNLKSKIVNVTDPAGRTTTLEINGHGHLISVQEPGLSAPMVFAYDPDGRMTHKQDERGFITSYVYDPRGRLQRVEKPPRPIFDPATGLINLRTQLREYTPADVTHPLVNDLPPGTPGVPLAALPRSDQMISRLASSDTVYEGLTSRFGSPLSAANPLGHTIEYERDERDRLTGILYPNGLRLEMSYDANGNQLSINLTGLQDLSGLGGEEDLSGFQNLTGLETLFTYEPRFNQLKTATDALGRTITYIYDYEVGQGERGLLAQINYPPVENELGVIVAPSASFEYNDLGLLVRSVNLRGVATCFVYTEGTPDEAFGGANPLFAAGVTPTPGLLTQAIEDCGGPLARTTFYSDFGAAGNAQKIIQPPTPAGARETTLIYDSRSRLISETNAIGVVTLYGYDDGDNLVEIIEDAGGRHVISTFTYDDDGRLLQSQISGDGQSIHFHYGYDLNGNLTRLQDGRGNMTRFFYDAASQLIEMVDALGQATQYSYDAHGQLVSETDPRGATTLYQYDALGRQTGMTEDFGGLNLVHQVEYDAANRVTAVIDPLGIRTCFSYDNHDRLVSQVEDCGGLEATITFGYDLNANLAHITNALGHTARLVHDRLDRPVVVTNTLGFVTQYQYDAGDNLIAVTDPLGRVTQQGFDALDRLITMTDPLGQTAAFAYDNLHNLVSLADKLGHTAVYDYDAFGRRVQVTDPLGGVTRYLYDANDNVTGVIDPLERLTILHYDLLDRPAAVIDPAGGVTRYSYDAVGNLTAVTDPLGRSRQFSYDQADRRTASLDPLNQLTTFTYDAAGNLLSDINPLGQATHFGYDTLYRPTSVTQPHGAVIQVSYDLLGNQLSLTDPNGNVTSFAYDALNRLVSETDPLGASRLYSYDAAGNMIALTDRNGRTTQLAYDDLDRVISQTWAGDGRVINYSYDAASNLTAVSDPDATYNMVYDALGRNTSVSNAGTPGVPVVSLNYSYDAFANLLAMSELIGGQAGATTGYQYNARNEISRITQQGGGAPRRVDFSYDAAGQMTAVQRYADLIAAQPVAHSSLSYNANGLLTAMSHTSASFTAAYGWGYDANNRLTGMTLPDGASSFDYDAFGQLLSADHSFQDNESYSYDAAGNRSDHVAGPGNRLLSDGTHTYEYDAEGNRTRRTHVATGFVTEYSWDYRQRLVEIVFTDNGGAVTQRISYTYDAFDRRIAAAVDPDGDGPLPAQVERFVYDGDNIALVFNGAGAITHRYLHGPYPDMVLAAEQGGGPLWPLADNLGSARDFLDNNGALQNHLVYDSYGRITGQTNPAINHRFAFTGREWDEAAGLYFYRSRYYDPINGRFLNEDTIGLLSGDANLYRYVGNSPTNFVDPLGLKGMTWGQRLTQALNTADRAVAGFADSLTAGLTTKARKEMYGSHATKNHQGTAFKVGQVAGAATSLATGVGGAVRGAQAAKLAAKSKEMAKLSGQAAQNAGRAAQAGRGAQAANARHNAKVAADIAKKAAEKAKRFRRSAWAGDRLALLSAASGIVNVGRKWYEGDPCDPLSWWDALALIPLAPFAVSALARAGGAVRDAFGRLRGTGPRLTPAQERAQALRELKELADHAKEKGVFDRMRSELGLPPGSSIGPEGIRELLRRETLGQLDEVYSAVGEALRNNRITPDQATRALDTATRAFAETKGGTLGGAGEVFEGIVSSLGGGSYTPDVNLAARVWAVISGMPSGVP